MNIVRMIKFREIKKLKWGKRIGNVRWYYLPDLIRLNLYKDGLTHYDTVLKIDFKNEQYSILKYPDFLTLDHPILYSAFKNNKFTRYKKNRPILHRKELMMDPEFHNLKPLVKLTEKEEKLGYYKDVLRIGREDYWINLVGVKKEEANETA